MSEKFINWLQCCTRDPCPYSQFEIVDVNENCELNESIKSELFELILNIRIDLELLRTCLQDLEWENIIHIIFGDDLNNLSPITKGDIGEMLFTTLLEKVNNYIIPVYKLRFKISPKQSLPGTDFIALKTNENQIITEVCYCESKLRMVYDPKAAVNAYVQLKETFQSQTPNILNFIVAVLKDRDDPLFETFIDYLTERRVLRNRDNFRIGLSWENSIWDENVLQNLEDTEIELPKLCVHVIRINNLSDTIIEIFNQYHTREDLNHD